MIVSALEAHLRELLTDIDADEYTSELIRDALYSAEMVIHSYRPDATAETFGFTCAEGSRQLLPLGYSQLLAVIRNTGGLSVSLVDEKNLNTLTPDWQQRTPQPTTDEYTFDVREKSVFYVNPPVIDGALLEVFASKKPLPYSGDDPETVVDDTYRQPLIEFAMFVLLSPEREGSPNFSRASRHLQTFASLLGVDWQAINTQSPKAAE